MILVDAGGEPGEQRGAIGSGGEGELLEIPGFAGREREALGIEHDFDGFRTQEEASVEALATGESEQHGFAARGREGHHAGDHLGVGGLRDFVVLELVVGEVERTAERAGGLAEHLEALAIERSGIGQVVGDAEERDFLDVDRRFAGVGEAGLVEVALARAGEFEGSGGLHGAHFGFGLPDVERGSGVSEGGGKEEDGVADHGNYFNAIGADTLSNSVAERR